MVVPETLPADRLLSILRERRSHQALVVDESGGVEGLVTLEDVVAEVLGAVGDEFKTVATGPEFLPDGRVRLPGATLLDNAAQWTGLGWELEGGPDTVGGYVTQVLGRIPAAGDHLMLEGALVEVEQMEDRAVGWVLVTLPNSFDSPGDGYGGDSGGEGPDDG